MLPLPSILTTSPQILDRHAQGEQEEASAEWQISYLLSIGLSLFLVLTLQRTKRLMTSLVLRPLDYKTLHDFNVPLRTITRCLEQKRAVHPKIKILTATDKREQHIHWDRRWDFV